MAGRASPTAPSACASWTRSSPRARSPSGGARWPMPRACGRRCRPRASWPTTRRRSPTATCPRWSAATARASRWWRARSSSTRRNRRSARRPSWGRIPRRCCSRSGSRGRRSRPPRRRAPSREKRRPRDRARAPRRRDRACRRPRRHRRPRRGAGAARADLVRGLGYDGSGTVVGMISDGIDHAADAQATGDLPAVTVPADARCRPGSGDEGTALLEIVHDLAPGAQLLFSEGLTSGLVFIDSVNCLVAAGAGVIADDLVFFDEPFFADGPLALAVRAAVQAGVSYHSAAGNEAQEHVEQPFRASPGSSFHDFLGGPADNADDMLVLPGVTLVCILQWNDPFGGSANDYELGIFDDALNLVASSTGVQDGTQDPLEVAGVTNTSGSAQVAKVAIAKFSGADRVLEMFCLDGVQQQYVTDGSVVGQAALPEVVAVGAIDVNNPGRVDVEPYSSRGPSQVFFPGPATRPKPDLAGFDGVSITNAGGLLACPPSCAFFGTSAATPHSAAVAALLLSKNPSLTPAHIQDALRGGAVDIGPAGFDDAAGARRLDALPAAALACTTDAER